MDMSIYYMHYDTREEAQRSRDPNKVRPEWFSYDLCFQNLLDSLAAADEDWNVELVLWFDGRLDVARAFLADGGFRFPERLSVKLMAGEFGGQRPSTDRMFHHIVSQGYADDRFIYILENDYLHRRDWLRHLKSLVTSGVGHTNITLYDHKDNYRHSSHATQVFETGTHLWKSTIYSCWSQICRYAVLKSEVRHLLKYDDRAYFADNAARGGRLVVPVPGLSTHAMTGLLSPAVDWSGVASAQG